MSGRIHPRRAAWGYGFISSPSNFGEVALVNDTPGPWVLDVRYWVADTVAGLNANGFRITNSFAGTLFAQGTPILGGEGAPPGSIYIFDDPNTFTNPDIMVNSPANLTGDPLSRAPLAVLRPGWALVVQCQTSGHNFGQAFYWQWLTLEELFWGYDLEGYTT